MNYLKFKQSLSQFPKYTVEEVRKHNQKSDGWIILSNLFDGIDQSLVVNVTEFLNHHPGGREVFIGCLGRDCTHEFLKYHVEGHSQSYEMIMELTIGTLTQNLNCEINDRVIILPFSPEFK